MACSILFDPDIPEPEEFERLTLRVVGAAECNRFQWAVVSGDEGVTECHSRVTLDMYVIAR